MRNVIRAAIALSGGALFLGLPDSVNAADHEEAPGTQVDAPADISDLYVWHNTTGQIVIALNFAGKSAPGVAAAYDAEVLYGVHIDNSVPMDGVADIDIWFRMGQNTAGDWGVQAENIPGADALVSGPVETAIDTEATATLKLWAGLRDDPFFFDFQGLTDTLNTGTLSFDATRNTFANENVTSIIFTMDQVTALGASPALKVWATSGRL